MIRIFALASALAVIAASSVSVAWSSERYPQVMRYVGQDAKVRVVRQRIHQNQPGIEPIVAASPVIRTVKPIIVPVAAPIVRLRTTPSRTVAGRVRCCAPGQPYFDDTPN